MGMVVVGAAASVVLVVAPVVDVVGAAEVVVVSEVVEVQAVTRRANAIKKQRRRIMSSDYRSVGPLN